MKILITGSSGFIGERLVRRLRELGIAFDTLKRKGAKNSQGVRWPEGIDSLDLRGYTAVIHLASAPVTQHRSVEELRAGNVEPVRRFLKVIPEETSFVFVTSQSATPDAESVYGKLKWECEELIRAHNGRWTILRPGLVVGPGSKGLFARMLSVVKHSPVVPLVGDGSYLLQPVDVDTVIDALITVTRETTRHSQQCYNLASAPVSLRTFLQTAATVLQKRCLFVPVPLFVLRAMLALGEHLLSNPPITRTNLLGLLHLTVLDGKQGEKALGLEEKSLQEILIRSISPRSISPLEDEANLFYRQLFGGIPPRTVIERYVSGHDFCCHESKSTLKIDLAKIIRHELDGNAIEIAIRRHQTVLSKKLALLCYLAEQESVLYDTFINSKPRLFKGFLILGLETLSTPWRHLKGRYLIWRYNLV